MQAHILILGVEGISHLVAGQPVQDRISCEVVLELGSVLPRRNGSCAHIINRRAGYADVVIFTFLNSPLGDRIIGVIFDTSLRSGLSSPEGAAHVPDLCTIRDRPRESNTLSLLSDPPESPASHFCIGPISHTGDHREPQEPYLSINIGVLNGIRHRLCNAGLIVQILFSISVFHGKALQPRPVGIRKIHPETVGMCILHDMVFVVHPVKICLQDGFLIHAQIIRLTSRPATAAVAGQLGDKLSLKVNIPGGGPHARHPEAADPVHTKELEPVTGPGTLSAHEAVNLLHRLDRHFRSEIILIHGR